MANDGGTVEQGIPLDTVGKKKAEPFESSASPEGEFKKGDQKIVIVGGGVAGYSLARRLAEEGFRPTVISKTGLSAA